jgi:hypothetical protein
MNGKNYLVAVLLCSMILALAFIQNSGSQTTFQYDPWADINDDGYIDGKDISYTCRLFGTTGDPTKNVNVTNWQPNYAMETYIEHLNITWKNGYGSVGLGVGGERWFGDFDKMYVYLGIENISESAEGKRVTIWISQIEWSFIINGKYVAGLEDLSPNVANVTFPGYTSWSGGPFEFEMKGPKYDFAFTVTSDAPDGWVIISVYVYLRNE